MRSILKTVLFLIVLAPVAAFAQQQTWQVGPQPPPPWTFTTAIAAEQRMVAAYAAELKALEAKMPDQAPLIEAKLAALEKARHQRFIRQSFGRQRVEPNRASAEHAIAAMLPDTADVKAAAQTHGVPFPALHDPETFLRSVK